MKTSWTLERETELRFEVPEIDGSQSAQLVVRKLSLNSSFEPYLCFSVCLINNLDMIDDTAF